MSVLSRFAKFGIPVAAAVVAGTTLFGDRPENISDKILLRTGSSEEKSSLVRHQESPTFSSSIAEMFPRKKWDYNWDSRDPVSSLNAITYETVEQDKKKRDVTSEEEKPTATRNIILIRHGQYNLGKGDKKLTPLGREQATLLGKRLAATGRKFDSLVMSTMPRAVETANLVLNELPSITTASDSILEEGAPYPPEPMVKNWNPKIYKFFVQGSRIEAAFRKYIHRAEPEQKQDSYELIVCHGNVIRYFVCRALQFPPEGWLRMAVANCSVTWLTVRPNGVVSLLCLGDVGHLPSDKISFN